MPKLRHCFVGSPIFSGMPVRSNCHVIDLTTREDREAAQELGLMGKVGRNLFDESEARFVHNSINKRANEIRDRH